MQAGVYLSKGVVKVQEWPTPAPDAGEVLVRVRYAGICGTDLLIVAGKHPRAVPPRVLGHEVFGEIVAARPPADPKWEPGMRVAVYPLISCGHCAPCQEGHAHVCERLGLIGINVDGGFAEQVKVLPEQLFRIPDEVSDEEAALVEPLAVAVHAVRTSGIQAGDTALVLGAGPIGNLIGQVLRAAGARAVVVAEVKESRRQLAQQVGLTCVDPSAVNLREAIAPLVGEPYVDHVIEASGAPAAYRDAVRVCKVRGKITFIGLPKFPPEVDILNLVFKEIRTAGARVYSRKDFRGAISLLERRAVHVTPLITDQLPLDEAAAGFQKLLAADKSLKILFRP